MAVTSKWYGQAQMLALQKKIDVVADDIRVALLTSAYTPDQDAHVYFADVVGSEVVGPGYVAGGVALAAKAIGYTPASNLIVYGASNPSWTLATFTARYAVYYDRSPSTDATRPLLSFVDFGADTPVAGGTFTLDVTAGIVTVTPA